MSVFLEILLTLVYQIPVACMRYIPFTSRFRFSIKKTMVLFFSALSLLIAIACVSGWYDDFDKASTYRLFLYLLMGFLSFYLIKERPGKQLFMISLYSSVVYTTSSFSLIAELLVYGDKNADHLLFKLIAYSIAFLILFPGFLHFIYTPLSGILFECGNEIWHLIWLPSVIMMLLPFFLVTPLDELSNSSFSSAIIRLAISLSTLITDITIVRLLKISTDRTEALLHAEAERSQNAIQQYQYRKMQQDIEIARRFRHDFKHHSSFISAIATDDSLSESERLQTLSDYCKEYFGSLPVSEDINYCECYPLNLLLNYYREKCKEAYAMLNIRVNIEENLPVSDTDLCVIVGNIFSNAIEAIEDVASDERKIEVVISQNHHNLLIHVTNGFSGKLLPASGVNPYRSTKEDGNGIGLSNVITIAKRYHGYCRFAPDETNPKQFVSKVFLVIG